MCRVNSTDFVWELVNRLYIGLHTARSSVEKMVGAKCEQLLTPSLHRSEGDASEVS